jgi:A/G-specific adenine glycosylase
MMAELPRKIIGAAVIWRDGKILIDRRKPGGTLGGLWEFPGGKLEPGETISQCITREIREELGIEITVGQELIVLEHTYEKFTVLLHVHHCAHVSGEPQPIECDEIRYVGLDELNDYEFPAANIQIIQALQQAT